MGFFWCVCSFGWLGSAPRPKRPPLPTARGAWIPILARQFDEDLGSFLHVGAGRNENDEVITGAAVVDLGALRRRASTMTTKKPDIGPTDGSMPLADDFAFAFEDPADLHELKEIKLRLPVAMHIRLHSVKIMDNRTISDVVTEAVEAYFAKMDGDA